MATRKNTTSPFGQKQNKQTTSHTVTRDIYYAPIPKTNLYAFKIEYKANPPMKDDEQRLTSQQGIARWDDVQAFLKNETSAIKGENIVLTSDATRKKSREKGEDANDPKKTTKLYDQLAKGLSSVEDLYEYNENTDEYTQLLTKKVLAHPIGFDYGYFNSVNYDLDKLQAEVYAFGEAQNWELTYSRQPIPPWSDVPGGVYLAITVKPTDEQMTEWMKKAKKNDKSVEDVVANILHKNMKDSKYSPARVKQETSRYMSMDAWDD